METGIVALTEQVDTAGIMIWWRLSGALNAEKLATAWKGAGLDEALLPDVPAPTTALRRALHTLETKHRFVRRLPAGGWALISENPLTAENDVALDTEVRAWVDAAGQVTVEPADHALAEGIRAAYSAAFEELLNVSGWLSRLTRVCMAVSLRDTGGIYFIPKLYVGLWKEFAHVVSDCSGHRFFEVPAMSSEEAVDAILDAVTREAEQEASGMEADLQNPELGARALRNRVSRCQGLANKVKAYAGLLGTSLEGLTERLSELEFGLGAAALKAEAEADAEVAVQ